MSSDGGAVGPPGEGRGAPGKGARRGGHRWPTWVLVVVMAVAGVVGMVLGYIPDSSHNRAVASSGPSFPSGSAAGKTTAPTTTRTRAGSSSGTTSVPVTTTVRAHGSPSSTERLGTTTVGTTPATTRPRRVSTQPRSTTTPPPTTTTLPVMRTVVLQTPQTNGPSSTPEFTIGRGPYEFGYAYDCEAAPTADQAFEVEVVEADGNVAFPVVRSTELKGTGSRVVARTGQQKLEVETAAACEWVLRVVAP